MHRHWTATAALMLAGAVALGAFGAHGLRERLSTYGLEIWEKAAFYHFIHGLALLALGLAGDRSGLSARDLSLICGLLLLGILLFSGSLYLLAITEIRRLGAVTPLGGSAFILAWLLLAGKVWRA